MPSFAQESSDSTETLVHPSHSSWINPFRSYRATSLSQPADTSTLSESTETADPKIPSVNIHKGMLQTSDPAIEAEDAIQNERCQKWKTKVLESDSVVKFMVQSLSKVGCPFTADHFKCIRCDKTRSGGFAPDHGVVLCQNNLMEQSHTAETMSHELIHAFDFCTVKLNLDNPKHYACTEIRAAALSGECRMIRELQRGNFGIAKHFQECVRRRAVMSLKQVETLKGGVSAEEAVLSVWDSCFNDHAPFDEVY